MPIFFTVVAWTTGPLDGVDLFIVFTKAFAFIIVAVITPPITIVAAVTVIVPAVAIDVVTMVIVSTIVVEVFVVASVVGMWCPT